MSPALKSIQQKLSALATVSSQAFSKVMVPGDQHIYGVKTPQLNQLAKQFTPESFTLVEELWNSGSLEEQIIAIKIIEKIGKRDPKKTLLLFKRFSKRIRNWAVCDGLGMQFLKGVSKSHQAEILELAARYNVSKDPWRRRLSLVMVERYTKDPKLTDKINDLIANLSSDKEYYVKKAVAWIMRNYQKGK